jgi:glycosyltransferase involved in cell wall biosynthesis
MLSPNNSESNRNLKISEHRLDNTTTVTVVIPALNEAENLPHILPKIPAWVHEIILVDGNSTDDTVAVAKRIIPSIKIVKQEAGTRGKGAGLRAGVNAATSDIVVLLDADGSTDPAEIPVFVSTLLAGADYAKGSRFLQGAGTVDMPLYRQIGNGSLVLLTNILYKTRYTDITYGYNAFWRTDAHLLAFEINGWACEIVNNIRAARNGLRIVEVASFEKERIAGEAKLQTWSAGWVILKAIVSERFARRTPDRKARASASTATKTRNSFLEAYFSRSGSSADLA